MKKCAFCGSTSALTGEHIIPNGLLKLFPEQDITFHKDTQYKDNEGLTINDVCEICNNVELSKLDSYGVSLIRDHFMCNFDANDSFSLEYDFNLLSRWLLKIAYNVERVNKDISIELAQSANFILKNDTENKPNFSIFSGLYVDMTAFGAENEGEFFIPLQVIKKPRLFPYGIVTNMYGNRSLKKNNSFKFKNALSWFVYRFGSAIFLLVLWNKNSSLKRIENDEKRFLDDFSFSKLQSQINTTMLYRVTDNFSCRNVTVIDGIKGIALTDKLITMSLGGRGIEQVRNEFKYLLTEESKKRGRILTELQMFPQNKKVQREYNQLFKNKIN